jgi:hypothetical protein
VRFVVLPVAVRLELGRTVINFYHNPSLRVILVEVTMMIMMMMMMIMIGSHSPNEHFLFYFSDFYWVITI